MEKNKLISYCSIIFLPNVVYSFIMHETYRVNNDKKCVQPLNRVIMN